MVAPSFESAVAGRTRSGALDDVINAAIDLGQRCVDQFSSINEPVRIDDPPPTLPDFPNSATLWPMSERPAELSDVLDATTGPKLLPIDDADTSTVDDHVAGLQVIVH